MKRSRSDRLDSGKFRLINEMLYTSHSKDSWELFHHDSSYFHSYHQGFNNQISSWPVNPLKLVEQQVRDIAKNDQMTLVDLGCGQGELELKLKDLDRLKIFSYDLVGAKDHVIECDVSKLPLMSKTVDIAVFCLSLMGTNHVDMLKEAHRILKKKGFLIVAEVSTRFSQQKFLGDMNKLGFKNTKKIIPNSFFSVFVFRTIRPQDCSQLTSVLNPCKYKKR